MTSSSGSNLYSQGFGTTSSNSFPGNAIKSTRAPSDGDVRGPQGNYVIGQLWVNTVEQSSFQLVGLSSSDGAVVASWTAIGGGSSSLSQLSGDTGSAFPVGGNINIVGGTGISTVASGDDVTISLSGAGAPIEQVNVQTGTTPITSSGGAITINGAIAAPGTNPVRTDGTDANTIAIEVQKSQAIASADATKIGLAAFNSADFTVDSTGFVSAVGGGFTREVGVDAATSPGTNPVLPDSDGVINVTGGQAAAGSITNIIQTNSLAANTYTIQVQRSQAVASSTQIDNGVCHFNSSQFTVDGAGFVSLTGEPVLTIDVQSGDPVVPTSGGAITITGSAVAATAIPVETLNSGANSFSVAVQYASSAASTDATKAGLSSFNSSDFTVDSNGFVTTTGGSFARKVSVDAATSPGTNPVLPDSGGVITVTGGQVPAGTTVDAIQTNSLAANTYTVQVQRSQAVASSTVGDNGICHFDSSAFTVDANGFVQSKNSSMSGTWTPILNINDSATGITYSSQSGTYVTIGLTGGNAIVSFTGSIQLTSKGSNSGIVTIPNLPVGVYGSGETLGGLFGSGITISSGYAISALEINGGSTIATLVQLPTGSTGGVASITDANISDTSLFYFSGTYQA